MDAEIFTTWLEAVAIVLLVAAVTVAVWVHVEPAAGLAAGAAVCGASSALVQRVQRSARGRR